MDSTSEGMREKLAVEATRWWLCMWPMMAMEGGGLFAAKFRAKCIIVNLKKCPKVEQCDGSLMSCECCTLELHVVCNFASYRHSTEHSNHEAYMQRIYVLPSHKPAENFLLQITYKPH